MNLDSKLLFKNHIKQIEVKVAKGVGILSKLRFLFPTSTLLLLYYALVHPHLLYALPLWGCTCQKYTQKLQLLQNKAIRVICNGNRYSSVTLLYFELGILKINELFKFEIGKLMHQQSNTLITFFLLAYHLYSPISPQSIVHKQDPKPKKVFTYLNFQLNVVKGLLSFRALKSGIRFPLNLKSFRLENLNINSNINL